MKPYQYLDTKLFGYREKSYGTASLFIIGALAFLAVALVGVLLSDLIVYPFNMAVVTMFTALTWLMDATNNSGPVIAAAIFLKNFLAISLCVLLARQTRGISLLLIILVNGLMIGSVLTAMDVSLSYKFFGIMTHGIFEFTAVFLGIAYGVQLMLLPELRHRSIKMKLLYIIAPLLIAAAFIEFYVTPLVLAKIGG